MNKPKRPMINDALRLLRLYLGVSQKQIADEIHLSQSMISEIESGSKPVTLDVIERYSVAFNVPMSKLLFFAEELDGEPVKVRGKLIVAPRIISILEKLSPKEISNAS